MIRTILNLTIAYAFYDQSWINELSDYHRTYYFAYRWYAVGSLFAAYFIGTYIRHGKDVTEKTDSITTDIQDRLAS